MQDLERIRIGDFVLNRAGGYLEDAEGAEKFLRPKSYRLLEFLCERRGKLVCKDELVRAVWSDGIASDDSLAHCVSDIRRVLGPETAKLLRTVPRRGYMLAASEVLSVPTPNRGFTSNRVFVTAIAACAMMFVAGLWLTMLYSKPGATSDAVGAVIRRADALLDSRDWRRRDANQEARQLLQQVVADYPEHPDPLAALGLTYWLEVQHLAWGGGRREMQKALELVERSVALGGSHRSHRLLAEMRLLAPFKELRSSVDALASARAAVALAPSDPDNLAVFAQALALTGYPEKAVSVAEAALSRNSNAPDWHHHVAGVSYLLSGDPARAIEQFGPLYGAGTFANARWWPGWLYAASLAHAGRIDEAKMVVTAARRQRKERSIAAVAHSFDGFADEDALALFLSGLRLAGLPG